MIESHEQLEEQSPAANTKKFELEPDDEAAGNILEENQADEQNEVEAGAQHEEDAGADDNDEHSHTHTHTDVSEDEVWWILIKDKVIY